MSDCEVCIGVDDIDDPFTESEVKQDKIAKRKHKCFECHGVIVKGEAHEHAAGRDCYWGEGLHQRGWQMYHTCNLCVEIRTVFTCGQSYYYGQLWEEFVEYVFPTLTTATKCFQKLSPPAKAFVLQRWQKWKGLQN